MEKPVLNVPECWMLTEPDNRTDGNKIAYLKQPEIFRKFDPRLFDMLLQFSARERHRLIIVCLVLLLCHRCGGT